MSFRDDYIAESANHLAQSFNAAATAHVAVDLQKGYFIPPLRLHFFRDGIGEFYSRAADTMNKIVALSCALENDGLHTVWVRHNISFPPGFFRQNIDVELSRYHSSVLKEFVEHAVDMAFEIPHGKIFDKPAFSAFSNTDFADVMKADHISTLLLTGGFREVCVEATARDAAKNGFETYIVDDLAISDITNRSDQDNELFYRAYAEKNIRIVTADQVKALLPQNTIPS